MRGEGGGGDKTQITGRSATVDEREMTGLRQPCVRKALRKNCALA